MPFLTERPSHYVKRIYVATQPVEEPENLRDLVTLMELYDGEDTTIYASDWPHHDFDHPMKLNQVPFSDDQRRKVFGENALELFRIDAGGRAAVTEAVVGRLADFPEGSHKVVAGRRPGDRRVQHRRALLRAAQPLPAPDRPAVRGPPDDRDARRGRDERLAATLGAGGRGDRVPVARAGVPRPDRALPRLSRNHAAPL